VRYALIGDIHGNLPALEAVLRDVESRATDAVYHLGDLVGYAPWPNEVVERIRAAEIPGVAGNFDSTIGLADPPGDQDESSRLNFDWTLRETTAANRDFLRALPFRLDVRPRGGHAAGPTLTLVHATPTLNTVAWWPHLPDEQHLEMAARAGASPGDVLVFGHIHRPWYREIAGIHFVSIGSVGRPKDGDWRACYVVLEVADGSMEVEFVRVEYDLEAAVRGIEASELPDGLGEFLRTGGAPAPV
jgi:predicted phosphodiesterase